MKLLSRTIPFCLVLLSAAKSPAFVPLDTKWPEPTTPFNVGIPGLEGPWQASFEAAMDTWNNGSPFTFTKESNLAVDPCNDPAFAPEKKWYKVQRHPLWRGL
ncbi:MAG: hypothetical protein JSU88_06450 [Nitrospinaceae bacterium]|jgi:hypothetical protein|nr:MAG: hypothetical protein JSU88_06450 [Nitrospinaceae bacterium]